MQKKLALTFLGLSFTACFIVALLVIYELFFKVRKDYYWGYYPISPSEMKRSCFAMVYFGIEGYPWRTWEEYFEDSVCSDKHANDLMSNYLNSGQCNISNQIFTCNSKNAQDLIKGLYEERK